MSASTRPYISFTSLTDIGGYKLERRYPCASSGSRFKGTLLEKVPEKEHDVIVPCRRDRRPVMLVSTGGDTKRYGPTRGEQRCFPTFDLANAAIRSGAESEAEEEAKALDFVRLYGPPNGAKEITYDWFDRIAFSHLNLLIAIQKGGAQAVAIRPRFKKSIDSDGRVCIEAENFLHFCALELMELIELGREIRECEYCGRWYALNRRSGRGRGRAGATALRFCPYGTCRQKSHTTRV